MKKQLAIFAVLIVMVLSLSVWAAPTALTIDYVALDSTMVLSANSTDAVFNGTLEDADETNGNYFVFASGYQYFIAVVCLNCSSRVLNRALNHHGICFI